MMLAPMPAPDAGRPRGRHGHSPLRRESSAAPLTLRSAEHPTTPRFATLAQIARPWQEDACFGVMGPSTWDLQWTVS